MTANKRPIERPRRERRDARRLDVAVERLVEEAEALVVRAVARAVDVEDRDDQARLVRAATHALVAWMYSEVVFGWPNTAIRPSRGMSRPTEIMFVASATSTRSGFVGTARFSASLASATLSVLYREVSSRTS